MINRSLIIRAPFCIRSGYETLSDTICIELSKNGYDVYPLSTNGEISNYFIKKLTKQISKEVLSKTELCILPIQTDLNDYNTMYRIPKVGKRIFFTMWESTQLSMSVIDLFNSGVGVIVPNEWNKRNFEIDGVNVPIFKCNLFIDTDIYSYKEKENDIFTFGTANADPRKRLNETIKCFCKAFSPSIKNVKLKIKIDNQDMNLLKRFSDDRIEINTKKLTKYELSNWYNSLDVFVSGVAAEGWGLMQHEAMACGVPLIATEYAGLAEFFDSSVGYPIKYTEVLSEWSWGYSNGFWSKFDEDDMIDKMRFCYNHREEVKEKGKLASKRAKQMDIKNFTNKLIEILNVFDI